MVLMDVTKEQFRQPNVCRVPLRSFERNHLCPLFYTRAQDTRFSLCEPRIMEFRMYVSCLNSDCTYQLCKLNKAALPNVKKGFIRLMGYID